MNYAHKPTIGLFACLLIVACGGGGSSGGTAPQPQAQSPAPPVEFVYSVPDDIADGWEVADLADEGVDTQKIVDMMSRVFNETYEGIDSVAIARNGKLLLYWFANLRQLDQFDAWVNNRDPERHVLHSTSKSVTSALVGIAIDQGHIASIDVPFYDLFSYSTYANWDPRKAEMTLEDALTMRLGFEWDEWSRPYTDPANDLVFLENNTVDWSKALLDLPMAHDPGTVFTYNTAATIAIGQAVQNATGMPMAEFANMYLFYPMQIFTAEWWRSPTNLPVGGSGLFLETRDLAKIRSALSRRRSLARPTIDQPRMDCRFRR